MKTYHKNPRTIKDKQFADLRAWLLELGDLSGIVHDLTSDEVISGNQRMRAIDVAKCEIVLTEGPHDPDAQGTVAHGYVIWQGAKYNYRQVRWDARQCEKANIVANKAGGGWDFDTLANEFDMGDLLEWGFEAEELGFMAGDDAPDDPGAQIDKAEELREKWGVETGQLWQLGDHRLICGDCTDAAIVARVMGGERAVLLCTDPPYGVDLEGAKYNPRAKAWAGIEGDKRQGSDLTEWLADCLRLWLSFCEEDLAVYLWTAAMQEGAAAAAAAAAAAGIHIQSQIIWNKNTLVLGQADYQWKHENCWYGFIKGKKHRWLGGRAQTTVWDISKIANSSYLHPMQKPSELYERAIENHTHQGEICAEPFSGSGTQIVACERLGRRCRAIEISAAYTAVALQRFYDMTGVMPVLVEA